MVGGHDSTLLLPSPGLPRPWPWTTDASTRSSLRLRTATDLSSLVSALEELGAVLVAHFAHEESPGGIYEVMGVARPELRTPLGDLLGEHYGLLTDIRALASRGHEIRERSHVDLYAEARQLAERLQVHEAKEDAMAGAISPGSAATWSVTR